MSMIRKSMPSGHDPVGGNRFSLATNAERVRAEITLERKSKFMRAWIISLSSLFLIGGAISALASGSESDFKAAYAAAEAANKEAGGLRNQWTVTAAALADAKKAADAGDFDQAVAQSKEAEALARASIYQAISEKEAWKVLEIK
jgi:hypothetical protein